MELNDSSEKDVDILKRQIGGEYKILIKQSSNDYLTKLKSELMNGFKTYFDELNTKIANEFQAQETQQKELHDKIDEKEEKLKKVKEIVQKRKTVDFNEKVLKVETVSKIKAFFGIKQYVMRKKELRKREALINKIILENKIRKIFKVLKSETLFEKTNAYEEKTKVLMQNDIVKMENTFKKQIEDMWNLIAKAEEKLKHENRKKVQVKLMLDQMVLRGISALNLQAMSLSQNSLKDVVKCDYHKEIDKKYNTMLFPDTKTTMKTKFKQILLVFLLINKYFLVNVKMAFLDKHFKTY